MSDIAFQATLSSLQAAWRTLEPELRHFAGDLDAILRNADVVTGGLSDDEAEIYRKECGLAEIYQSVKAVADDLMNAGSPVGASTAREEHRCSA